jgi:hypothetical protein
MNDRSEYEGWVNGYTVKAGLFVLDKLPECLLGQSLGCCVVRESCNGLYGRTSVLVSSWCFSALLLADLSTVLVPVFLGETIRQSRYPLISSEKAYV